MIIVFITNNSINRIIYNIYYLSCNNIIRNHFTYIIRKVLILNLVANGWYMLSGRISESVPVRRTWNCETRIRTWRTTKPRPAICTLLAIVFFMGNHNISSLSRRI